MVGTSNVSDSCIAHMSGRPPFTLTLDYYALMMCVAAVREVGRKERFVCKFLADRNEGWIIEMPTFSALIEHASNVGQAQKEKPN